MAGDGDEVLRPHRLVVAEAVSAGCVEAGHPVAGHQPRPRVQQVVIHQPTLTPAVAVPGVTYTTQIYRLIDRWTD